MILGTAFVAAMTMTAPVADKPVTTALQNDVMQQQMSQSLAQSLGQMALEHRLALPGAQLDVPSPAKANSHSQVAEAE